MSLVSAVLLLLFSLVLFSQPSINSTSLSPNNFINYEKRSRKSNFYSCAPLLKTSVFNPCKSSNISTCFLFIREEPYIKIPKILTNEQARELQTPFTCHTPPPYLEGIAFEIFTTLYSANPNLPPVLCAWAGSEESCPFRALVKFVNDTANDGYSFSITGLLLDMPERRKYHFMSAPIVYDRAIIIGHIPKQLSMSSKQVFKQLVSPFHTSSWIVVIVSLIALLLVSIIAVSFISRADRAIFSVAVLVLLGQNELQRNYIAHQRRRSNVRADQLHRGREMRLRFIPILLNAALITIITVIVLFYELGVVNFIFQSNDITLGKSITALSRKEIAQFSVIHHSALEEVFEKTINSEWNKTSYNNQHTSSPLWKQCINFLDCMEMIKNESNDVNYMFTMDTVGRYLLLESNNCNTMAIIQTNDVLYGFNGGWLFGPNVKHEFQSEINSALIDLQIEGRMRRIIEDEIGDNGCQERKRSQLSAEYFIVPYGLLVAPFLFGAILLCVIEVVAIYRDTHFIQSENNTDQFESD